MIRIRLKRIGRKRVNAFRILAVDARKQRDTGKFIEDLGYYQPQSTNTFLSINLEAVDKYISKGAVPSERLVKLIGIARENPEYVRAPKN